MAKRNVQFAEGAYYHVYNRGAHRRSIFEDEHDYLSVLRSMKDYSHRFNITVIAYCLMPNHYHWLLRQDGDVQAGQLPQRVWNGYVKEYNLRHNVQGTLFEAPYKSKLIDKDAYLFHLCRYIHGNPVKDGFVQSPEQWPYSNYLDWIGARNGTMVDRTFVHLRYPDTGVYAASLKSYLAGIEAMPEEFNLYLEGL